MDASSPPAGEERREAQVVAEHLPPGYTADFHHDPDAGNASAETPPALGSETEQEPVASGSGSGQDTGSSSNTQLPSDAAVAAESSLLLQGGDMHRDMFKIQKPQHRRAATVHDLTALSRPDDDHPTISEQLLPQGFRRAFLRQQALKGDERAVPEPATRTFFDFLDLYGSFAGEDLRDFDDDDETPLTEGDEEEDVVAEDDGEEERLPDENRPLLGRRKSTARPARSASASTGKTFATLLKAFIGTGIMFLPKAFANGGILFSSLAMLSVSAVSMWAFHLLLACKTKYGGGYGDIGQAISGPTMRNLILGSITLSQLGFVCAGTVFVAENMLSFCEAVSQGSTSITTTLLIGAQVIILIPLAWIRNIAKLGPIAQIADVFIFFGLGYIFYYCLSSLTTSGLAPSVVLFNPDKYTLTIGSAIFTFEGIGLILPIQSSMRKPAAFEPLLAVVMAIITIIYTGVGLLCYATFGAATDIEVISNFPQDDPLVNAVQLLYTLAVLVGTPIQLFPALRVLESNVFPASASGKRSSLTKWGKNAFRAGLVCFCALVAVWGAGSLDFFVALIGSFACIPLLYIYVPYLHYVGVAERGWEKAADAVLFVVGCVAMGYTTIVTIKNQG